jgi:hypothetical protein
MSRNCRNLLHDFYIFALDFSSKYGLVERAIKWFININDDKNSEMCNLTETIENSRKFLQLNLTNNCLLYPVRVDRISDKKSVRHLRAD